MRKRKTMQGLALCMSLAVTSAGIPMLPLSVQAETTSTRNLILTPNGTCDVIQNPKQQEQMGAWSGSYLTFGSYAQDADGTKKPIRWRVLDTASDSNADGTKDSYLLLSDEILDCVPFQGNLETDNTWQNSQVRQWMNESFLSAFSKKEQEALAKTTKEADGSVEYLTDSALNEDTFFLLSAQEAQKKEYGFWDAGGTAKANSSHALQATAYAQKQGVEQNNGYGDWWLRSIGSDGKYLCGIIDHEGWLFDDTINDSAVGVAPAMNLKPERIAYVWADGVKKGDFAAVGSAATDTNTWDVTLKGSDGDLQAAAGKSGEQASAAVTIPQNQTLIISHKAAKTVLDDATQVSAMLQNNDGEVLYYGKINGDTQKDSSELILPKELATGAYQLYVFAEQIAEGCDTVSDFGQPISVTVTEKEEQTEPSKENPTTPSRETSSTPSKETPSTPSKENSSTPSKENSSTPGEEKPSTPSEENPSTPSKEKPSMPSGENSSTPSKENSSTPSKVNPSTPSTPSGETSSIPSKANSSTPSKETPSTPSKENSSTPSKVNPTTPSIPSGETSSIPSKANPSTPSKETPNTPSKGNPTMPGGETSDIPSRETPSTPSKETSSTPSKETPSTSSTPSRETPGTPSKETPSTSSTPSKNTPSTPSKETPSKNNPSTPSKETPSTSSTPSKNTPSTPSKETPSTPSKNTPSTPSKNNPSTSSTPSKNSPSIPSMKPSETPTEPNDVEPSQDVSEERFKVTYKKNTSKTVSGMSTDKNTYEKGSTATVKGSPSCSSQFFAGWNTKEDGSGEKIAPGAEITIQKDITLYAQWKTTYTSNKLTYRVNGKKTVACSGGKDGMKSSIKIPATITYSGVKYKVTEVASKAFYKNKKLTSVTIEDNVTCIRSKAFYQCKNLKKVVTGSGLTKIESLAFGYNKKDCTIKIKSTKLKTVNGAQNKGTKKLKIQVPSKKKMAYKKLFKETLKNDAKIS